MPPGQIMRYSSAGIASSAAVRTREERPPKFDARDRHDFTSDARTAARPNGVERADLIDVDERECNVTIRHAERGRPEDEADLGAKLAPGVLSVAGSHSRRRT